MSALSDRLSHAALLACPSCGHEFTGRWVGCHTAAQQCGACGHVFEATWPGFTFEPRTRVIAHRPAKEPGNGEAGR